MQNKSLHTNHRKLSYLVQYIFCENFWNYTRSLGRRISTGQMQPLTSSGLCIKTIIIIYYWYRPCGTSSFAKASLDPSWFLDQFHQSLLICFNMKLSMIEGFPGGPVHVRYSGWQCGIGFSSYWHQNCACLENFTLLLLYLVLGARLQRTVFKGAFWVAADYQCFNHLLFRRLKKENGTCDIWLWIFDILSVTLEHCNWKVV